MFVSKDCEKKVMQCLSAPHAIQRSECDIFWFKYLVLCHRMEWVQSLTHSLNNSTVHKVSIEWYSQRSNAVFPERLVPLIKSLRLMVHRYSFCTENETLVLTPYNDTLTPMCQSLGICTRHEAREIWKQRGTASTGTGRSCWLMGLSQGPPTSPHKCQCWV